MRPTEYVYTYIYHLHILNVNVSNFIVNGKQLINSTNIYIYIYIYTCSKNNTFSNPNNIVSHVPPIEPSPVHSPKNDSIRNVVMNYSSIMYMYGKKKLMSGSNNSRSYYRL